MKKFTFLLLLAAALTAGAAEKKVPVPVQSAKKSPLLMTAAPLPQGLAIGSSAPVPRILGWVTKEEVDFTKVIGKKPLVLFFYVNSNRCAESFSRISKTAKRFAGKAVFAAIGCDSYVQLKNFFRLKELTIPVAADLELQTLNCFLRSENRVPVAVVIDAKGVLAWRGDLVRLEPALKEICDGRYNVAKAAEKERLMTQVSYLMRAGSYDAVLSLLAAERLKEPDAFELLSLQCSIYAEKKKDYGHALELVEAEIRRNPKKYANYALGLKLAQRSAAGKHPVSPWYDRIILNFPDQPRLLIDLARRELAKPIAEVRLAETCKLCRAAWNAPKFASYREQAAIGREYARTLYYCGRPDLAAEQITATLKICPKKSQEQAALQADQLFYGNVVRLSRGLKGR